MARANLGFVLIRNEAKARTAACRVGLRPVAGGEQRFRSGPAARCSRCYRCSTEEPSILPSMMSRAYCTPILCASI